MQVQIPDSSTTCSNCDVSGNKAKVRCVNCREYLCDTCFNFHNNLKAMKDHKIITMDDILSGHVNLKKAEENRYCKTHGKLYEYYCEIEKRALCSDCIATNDCQHSCVSLKKAARKHADELQGLVRQNVNKLQEAVRVTRNARAELDINSQLAKESLAKKEEEYIDLVKKTVSKLNKKVDQIKEVRTQLLHNKQAELESTIEVIHEATEETIRVLESEVDIEILSSHATLSSQLQDLSLSQLHTSDKSLGYVSFKATMPSTLNMGQLLTNGRVGEKWKQVGEFRTGAFDELHGLDINEDGDVVVCSWEKGVRVFTREGKVKCKLFEHTGAVDVAVTQQQTYVIVTQEDNCKILLCDKSGKETNITLDMNKQSSLINSVAVDVNGRILVGHVRKSISIHNIDGSFISKFTTQTEPFRLSATSTGEIVSSVNGGDSLQLMDYTGGNIRVIQPPAEIKVWKPGFVCCRQGEIFVSNEGRGDPTGVYRFTSEGDYLGCVTRKVSIPSGIAISKDGTELFVADFADVAIKIFQRP